SFLAGPLTRNQIKKLMDPVRGKNAPSAPAPTPRQGSSSSPLSTDDRKSRDDAFSGPPNKQAASPEPDQVTDAVPPIAEFAPPSKPKLGQRPLLPPEIPQFFLPVRSKGQTG